MILSEFSFETVLLDSRFFRKGVVLTLTDKEGRSAQAEISPLPGWSRETLDDVLAQLAQIKRVILTTWWTKKSLRTLQDLLLYPSVYFGLESALSDLVDPISDFSDIKTYALLLGSPDEMLQRANAAYEEGYRFAKIKLGHLSVHQAHKIIEKTIDRFSLRLDFNQKWNIEESISFCERYPKNTFEYVEEPANNPADLFLFPQPFALDETLRSPHFTKYLHLENLKILIVKPTMLYPIQNYLKLEKKVVLTSSFEGPLGIDQIKKLAKRHQLEETLHGLDTLKYMSNQVLEKAAP